MIVVVEGPSAAGKTTWCRRHASIWIPEPEPAPLDEVLRAQRARWHAALDADAEGEVVVLDGDPLKLWYSYAERVIGEAAADDWRSAIADTRRDVERGDLGFADLVLYADVEVDELRRRKAADATRTRRNFERHTAMAPSFRRWYEVLAEVDADARVDAGPAADGVVARVIWEHPVAGLAAVSSALAMGPRPRRSDRGLLDAVLERLGAGGLTLPSI